VGAVVTAVLQVTLEALEVSLKCELLLDNSQQSLFDIGREVIKTTNSHGGSVECDGSKAVVFTRQEHLKETKAKM